MDVPRISFFPTMSWFSVQIGLGDMNPRDQLHLFNALADKLGLTEASHERPDESYQVLWKEMMDRHW